MFRRYRQFGWVINYDDGPEWSSRKYANEEDARTALGEAMGVGEI
jgi:hypothetical protein